MAGSTSSASIPNFTAAFSLCGLCMLIYLVVSRWKLWVLIPAAAAGAGMFMALPLSDSRTGMIAFLLCVVIAAAVGFQRLPIPAKWRRIAGIACVVVLVAVVAVAGFGAAVKVVSTTSDGEQGHLPALTAGGSGHAHGAHGRIRGRPRPPLPSIRWPCSRALTSWK